VLYAPSNPVSQALMVAAEADVAIVFATSWSSEGIDRTTLSLGPTQDALISGVASVQPNTAVVIHTPGAVLMPWLAEVSAVLCAFFPGQMDGAALAPVLFGDVNPSGRLPVTFPVSDAQSPVSSVAQYPGIANEANYSENLLVGYRWYDQMNQTPLFPFGHGLSYTTFRYTNLQVNSSGSDSYLVTVQVTNVGLLGGHEIVQLYIGFPAAAQEPPKSLKGFEKLWLDAGDTDEATFLLTPEQLSVWDLTADDWALVPGVYQVYVGASSRDIRVWASFKI